MAAAAAKFIGPVYCDTFLPGTDQPHMWLGMHEPVNTVTNAAILIAAWFAYRYVKRSGVKFSSGLILLLFLLTWVGIGSALWHGLRTPWALALDTVPGVLFLLVLTVVWIKQLYGWWAGIFGMVAMVAVSIAGVWLFAPYLIPISRNLFALPMFAAVAVTGFIMVRGAWKKYGAETGRLGVWILATGLSAAFFRSIDLLVCPYITIGTHFLWHIGLSTAACLGIVLMVRMRSAHQKSEIRSQKSEVRTGNLISEF